MDYNIVLQNFINYLKSINYNLSYANYVKLFLNYLQENNIQINNVNQDIIINFFNATNYKPETKNLFIKSMRKFYDYLGIENPFKTFKYIRVEKKYPKFITKKEFDILYNYVRSIDLKFSIILKFAFYSGLRISEIINLQRDNFNFEKNTITIYHTKTKHSRIIVIPEKVKTEILDFFNKEVEIINAFNITKNEFIYKLKKYSKTALNKQINPHQLRHSFARYLLDKGVSLNIVSKLLGHKNLLTTSIYLEPDEELIRDVYKQKIG